MNDLHRPASSGAGRQRRADYIAHQKSLFGRKSVAVLPVHFPRELLTAFDLLAVELWGPPGPPRGPDAGRIQTYVCALARNALAFLSSGAAPVDALLVPHTCDSLQGLATLATDFGGWGSKAFVFQHARGNDRDSARAFVAAELKNLADEIAAWLNRPLDPERLDAALELHREIQLCRAMLLRNRARSPLSDRELYGLLRRGEWLWPAEHLAELRASVADLAPEPVQKGIPILVTGYVPEPGDLLDALGSAGLFIGADDYAAVGRRVAVRNEARPNPWDELVERTFAMPPCPTRGADQAARMRHLESLAERAGAAGVLVHVQKFCEPELFDVPAIRRTFAARKLPVLVIEGELETSLSGQTETRLEAFAEMLRANRRAA